VIDDWVYGPVELLAAEDVAELEAVLRPEFPGGTRAGWLYVCWRAEVNLALGREGDAVRLLRKKGSKPGVDLRGLGVRGREWVETMGAKVKPMVDQAPGIGGLFKNVDVEARAK
jgi:hypothetical protein